MTKIYLTDDEPVPIRVLTMTLQREGYEVETFANGREALERIRECRPDALVTDIEMPVMTGEQLCKQLNSEMPDRDFPIFVVTSLADLAHRGWAGKMHRLSFIEKPVSMRTLTAKLRAELDGGASHGRA